MTDASMNVHVLNIPCQRINVSWEEKSNINYLGNFLSQGQGEMKLNRRRKQMRTGAFCSPTAGEHPLGPLSVTLWDMWSKRI